MSAATCSERPRCAVCGRHYEDGHDADTHETRTLCDGSTVMLCVTWIDRSRAAAEFGLRTVEDLRNYEIEDALAKRLGGAWIVAGPCPFNGTHTSSGGKVGADEGPGSDEGPAEGSRSAVNRG